jgi:hypothetical protein
MHLKPRMAEIELCFAALIREQAGRFEGQIPATWDERVHLPQRWILWLNCRDTLFKCHCVELRSRLSTNHSSPDKEGTQSFASKENALDSILICLRKN